MHLNYLKYEVFRGPPVVEIRDLPLRLLTPDIAGSCGQSAQGHTQESTYILKFFFSFTPSNARPLYFF